MLPPAAIFLRAAFSWVRRTVTLARRTLASRNQTTIATITTVHANSQCAIDSAHCHACSFITFLLLLFSHFRLQFVPDLRIELRRFGQAHHQCLGRAVEEACDEIVEQRKVEKIRTIGDAYMAAAGVPIEWGQHATAIVDAALDMQNFIDSYEGFAFRIGVSSGPLVGGVVGTSKFQYDIWGDTVNVASRMESSGQPGRVQISDATYQLIRDDFECELRGEIEVKGKGLMRTWFVLGRIT